MTSDEDKQLPVIVESCGHTCGAVRHIEDLAHDVDMLRLEVRRVERHHKEDCDKIWFKLGVLMIALSALVPSGWAGILGVF